jgi:hypothetical protein
MYRAKGFAVEQNFLCIPPKIPDSLCPQYRMSLKMQGSNQVARGLLFRLALEVAAKCP